MNWTIKTKLTAGLVGLTGLAIAVGGVGWLSLREVDATLNGITDVSAPTVETADDLIMELWEATKVAEEVAGSEEPDEIAELVAEFNSLMQDYARSEVDLRGLVEAPEVIARIDEASATIDDYLSKSRTMFEQRLEHLRQDAATRAELDNFDAKGAALTDALDALADANEAEMAAAETEGDRLEARGGSGAEVNIVLGNLFDRDFPVLKAAMSLQRLVIEMQDTAGEYLAETETARLKTVEQEFDALERTAQSEFETLDEFAANPQESRSIVDLRNSFDALVAVATADGALFDRHERSLAALQESRRALTHLEDEADAIAEDLDFVAEAADAISDNADTVAAATVASSVTMILAFVGTGVAAAVGLIVMVVSTVTRPLNALTDAMTKLAQGDTSADVVGVERNDELGAMARCVQVFKENAVKMAGLAREKDGIARRFEQEVGGVIESVAGQATELQSMAAQLTSAVGEATQQSGGAAVAVQQASSSVQTMAAAAEELSAAISDVSAQLGTAASKLDTTTHGAREAQSRMDDLTKAVGQIDEVVASINNVAEQTNLLALNATIEAARAGDAGRGFAVVASEVKTLANQTRQMTESIATQLATVKAASDSAVEVSRRIVVDVDDVNKVTGDIATSMQHQNTATAEISQNAHHAANGTGEVVGSIERVRSTNEQSAQATDSVRQSADELAKQAEVLRASVRQFLDGLAAA